MNPTNLFLLKSAIILSMIPSFFHWFLYQTHPPTFVTIIISISIIMYMLTGLFDKLDEREER
ncbi:hypothetical protein C8P63_1294 [Melghirimyces profundicolus]|uniref:Uncharacterized protein n=1 Tax=Melghirimyces profundicolus TaxID=1242148 RepID=A0A2T6BAK1_9BACL|nr:hypothetical protein [Melghirimyces profundicolus]PTX53058.1 hypothetical protein C8P63_1294 [Melghirimyces profundicolus]